MRADFLSLTLGRKQVEIRGFLSLFFSSEKTELKKKGGTFFHFFPYFRFSGACTVRILEKKSDLSVKKRENGGKRSILTQFSV